MSSLLLEIVYICIVTATPRRREGWMWALLTCVSVSFKQQEWCTLVWWSRQPGRRAPSTLIWEEDHQLHTSCYVLPFTATITKQQSRISLTSSTWNFILCCLVRLRDQDQSVSLFIANCMNPSFFLKERGTLIHSVSSINEKTMKPFFIDWSKICTSSLQHICKQENVDTKQ